MNVHYSFKSALYASLARKVVSSFEFINGLSYEYNLQEERFHLDVICSQEDTKLLDLMLRPLVQLDNGANINELN